MTMMRSPKTTTYTIGECNAELETIRKEYKKVTKGFRDQVRTTLQSTQIVLGRLRRNKMLKTAYQASVLKTRQSKRGVSKGFFDLSLEVVVRATGAPGRNGRKLASKRARMLDHLRDLAVPEDETAAYIKKNGGIEKLYREWVQKKKAAEDQSDDTKKSRTAKKKPSPTTNDQTITVKVTMSLSDRDKIAESKIGTGAWLRGEIVGGGMINITHVSLEEEEDGTWE